MPPKKNVQAKPLTEKQNVKASTVKATNPEPTKPQPVQKGGSGKGKKPEVPKPVEEPDKENQSEESPSSSPEPKPKNKAPKKGKAQSVPDGPSKDSAGAQLLVGVTPTGRKFYMPKTKSALHLSLPWQWTFFEWIKYLVAAFHVSFLFLDVPPEYFVASFIFWRFGYNLGIGLLLHYQSNHRSLSNYFKTLKPGPFWKGVVAGEMEKGYDYDKYPPEFNAWLLFRGISEVILANDLITYGLMCYRYMTFPSEITAYTVVTYTVATVLAFFALWAKVDAYRVIKDFAWFWGDFFFLVDQKLVFNRVFSLFPHPMYTVGYAFFYSAWIISQSETILYVSLFGHFCQLLFLHFVETPHIERTYPEMIKEIQPQEEEVLFNKATGYYTRKDMMVFFNIDIFRSSDLFLLLTVAYTIVFHLQGGHIAYYIGHAVLWRVFHSGVLGYILYRQSKDNFWNNHWSKKRTKHQGFEEWKRLYNSSLTMNYVSMISVAIKLCDLDFSEFMSFDSIQIIRILFGIILIALNLWTSISTYEVLGENGWFYGDFFIHELPSKLYYTGIYRYLNNPDSTTGFAGFYGLFIISGSWVVLALAVFAHGCHLLFLSHVEVPHMKRLYGNSLREKAGFEEGVKAIIDEEKLKLQADFAKARKTVEEGKRKVEKAVADVGESVKRTILKHSSRSDG